MASKNTHRFFSNNKRLSTAVEYNGTILQVHPVKRSFASLDEWKTYWTKNTKLTQHFTVNDKPAPAPAPARAAEAEESPVRQPQFPKEPEVNPEDWTVNDITKFTAPPGKYYIGDLCYVLGDGHYDRIFGKIGGFSDGLYQKRDSEEFFFVAATAWGDGCYIGSDGNQFAVDAGIIGITPISCCHKDDGGGHFYTFKKPVTCIFRRGVFTFVWSDNELVIDTHGRDEDEDYDE
jgi:hypothetical protein